jgi:hypothetical protein
MVLVLIFGRITGSLNKRAIKFGHRRKRGLLKTWFKTSFSLYQNPGTEVSSQSSSTLLKPNRC